MVLSQMYNYLGFTDDPYYTYAHDECCYGVRRTPFGYPYIPLAPFDNS